ncbi:hypothetical protein V2J09_014116 [Rumex salicifolius]
MVLELLREALAFIERKRSKNEAVAAEVETKELQNSYPQFPDLFHSQFEKNSWIKKTSIRGLPESRWNIVQKLTVGKDIFLFDSSTKLLHMVFVSTTNGRKMIRPQAFYYHGQKITQFPCQVQVQRRRTCVPLKPADYARVLDVGNPKANRFLFELYQHQVEELNQVADVGEASVDDNAAYPCKERRHTYNPYRHGGGTCNGTSDRNDAHTAMDISEHGSFITSEPTENSSSKQIEQPSLSSSLPVMLTTSNAPMNISEMGPSSSSLSSSSDHLRLLLTVEHQAEDVLPGARGNIFLACEPHFQVLPAAGG